MMDMVFIKTDIFTEDCKELLTDEEYRQFQLSLVANPTAGDVIQDTGGLRKIRWAAKSQGKRGGVRIIYYFKVNDFHIRLLLIYKKGIKDDLTGAEKKVLRQLNERW